MKRKFSILRILILAFISLIIGHRLYIWNAETLVGNAMPMPFGTGIAVVLSGSMEPELSVDDLVIVRAADTYNKGDVVVYQDGNGLVIHRIIDSDDNSYTTKGDANNVPDPPVKKEMIKGRMTARISSAGAVVRFIKTPAGFFLMIAAAVLLFEIPYLSERKKALAQQEKIKEEIRKLKEE